MSDEMHPTSGARVKRYRMAMRDKGFVRLELHVHEDDAVEIKAFAEQLAQRREATTGRTGNER